MHVSGGLTFLERGERIVPRLNGASGIGQTIRPSRASARTSPGLIPVRAVNGSRIKSGSDVSIAGG